MKKNHAPSEEEQSQLLEDIGPLPLRGLAWPRRIKVLIWIVLALIGVQLVITASGPGGQNAPPMVAGSILLCYAALIVLAWYMQASVTTIDHTGIHQTWISRREIAWEDIHFAKFIPLFASKRLMCFTGRGRPVIFQAGTRELEIAFARISLVYRRRN